MKNPKRQINVRKQKEVRTSIKFILIFALLVTTYFVIQESMNKKNRLDGEVQAVGVVISDDGTVMQKEPELPVSGVVTQDLTISIRPRLANGAKTNDR